MVGTVIIDGCGGIDTNMINDSEAEYTTSLPTHPEEQNINVPIKQRDDLYESRLGSIEYESKK